MLGLERKHHCLSEVKNLGKESFIENFHEEGKSIPGKLS